LKCSFTLEALKEPSEKVLKDLGYEYHVTRTPDVLEYEVVNPENFIVRINRFLPLDHPFGLMGHFLGDAAQDRKKREISDVEIVVFGQSSSARKFATLFVASMKETPWNGLRGSESSRAKKEWTQWLDSREL
jgi:hypothetical protein